MRFTTLIEWGWCGFGASCGLIPEVRLGIVRLACCQGTLVDRVRSLEQQLTRARNALINRVA